MTKEAQRARSTQDDWRIANDLRGSVDGWDFKQYASGCSSTGSSQRIWLRTSTSTSARRAHRTSTTAAIGDEAAEFGRAETVVEGLLHPSQRVVLVERAARRRNDENLNETLERVFHNIEGSAVGSDSEYDLKGLFDDLDVNSSKLGQSVAKRNERLVKLLDAIGDLSLGEFADNTIDVLVTPTEYLMTMYASGAGKSGGEF